MNKLIERLYQQAHVNREVYNTGNSGYPELVSEFDYTLFAQMLVDGIVAEIMTTDLENMERGDSEVLRTAARQVIARFSIL
jgi:hypothetical protein